MVNNQHDMKQLKHIITSLFVVFATLSMAQTQPNRPTGATPYGSLWITPDGLVWTGSASVGYTAVGSKEDYEALISAGYSDAQIDSIATDVYNRARARANHTGTQEISTVNGLQSALNAKADKTTTVSGTDGLTGGGDLSANRTIGIANGGVTNARMANMANSTIKGRTSTGAGVPEDLSTAQVRSMLNINNVDNTSDANKPISTATATALGNKVDKSTTINGAGGIDVGGSLSSGSVSISANDTYFNNRYLRKDINDSNGANTLTLGGVVAGNATITQLDLPSLEKSTTSDSVVVLGANGRVKWKELDNTTAPFTVANGAGVPQFTVAPGETLRINATGDASTAFNSGTKTVTINSSGGSTGGGVDSWNARTGAVVPQSGDYTTAQVTESGNLYFTEGRVRSTVLVGLSTATVTPVVATDNILQGIGKLQGQMNNRALSSRNLTVSGTAGRIVASGGAQNLTADREWILDLATSGVTPGTYTKTTFDTYGRATAGSALTAGDIPNLPTSKVTSGTFDIARMPTGTTGSTVALGNHTHALGDLSNVSLTTPSNGQLLSYNGTNWVNSTVTIPTVNNGTLTMSGSNGLTGSATFTANQSGNSTFTVSPTYGTTAGTIAQGNDSRINNGQTAFGWGDHSQEGYALDSGVIHTNSTAETKLGKLTIDNDFEVRQNLQINRLSIYNDRSKASNFSTGVLVETDITESSTSFALELLMNGNTGSVEKVLISGYKSGTLTGTPNTFDAVTLDPNVTEAVYAVKNGKLYFWVTGLPYGSLNVAGKLLTGFSTSFNRITSISNSVKPTTPEFDFVYSKNTKTITTREWANSQGWLKSADLSGYVPYTGATSAVNLGNNSFTTGSWASFAGGNATIASSGNVTATSFIGPLTGNATTATTLQTARTIALSGGATGTATSFNGSANITIPVTGLNASNLNAGTVPIARIPTGTTGSTVALGDHTHSQYVAKAGDTMSGRLNFSGTGVNSGIRFVSGAEILTITGSEIAHYASGGHSFSGGTVKIGNLAGSGDRMMVAGSDGTVKTQALPVNTTYSAGNGLTLSGTTFSLPVTSSGSGVVTDVAQTSTGISVTKGNVPFANLPTGTTSSTVAVGNHTHTFASITGKPTTASGYGITDAVVTGPTAQIIGGIKQFAGTLEVAGNLLALTGSNVVVPNAINDNQAVNLGQLKNLVPSTPDHTSFTSRAQSYSVGATQTKYLGLPWYNSTIGNALAYTGQYSLSEVGAVAVVEYSMSYYNSASLTLTAYFGYSSTPSNPETMVEDISGDGNNGVSVKIKHTLVRTASNNVEVTTEVSNGSMVGNNPIPWKESVTTNNYSLSATNIPIFLRAINSSGSTTAVVNMSPVTVTVKKPLLYYNQQEDGSEM